MLFSLIDLVTMKIEHPHKPTLVASIRDFKMKGNRETDDGEILLNPFLEINSFIQNKISRADQERIYQAYNTIFEEFAIGNFDIDIVNKTINDQFKIIYSIVRVDEIFDYMEKNKMFKIPPDIEKEYTGEYPEERTYIEPKYKGLIALGMAGRMAIPVWGEYTPIRKNAVGAKRIPIPLLQMLNGTTLIDSEQFRELEVYSSATVGAGKFDPGRVAAGYGTEYNQYLNLASNFVKKVAVTLNTTDNTLAKDIYNYIANNGAYGDASTGDVVWNKKDPNQEEEKSKWEKYNLREQMSQGDICMIEHYLSEPSRIIKHILSDLEPSVQEHYIERAKRLAKYLDEEGFIPTIENIRIAQWVLATVVPAKTLTYVGYFYQRNALAATVEIVRHLGFPLLAALLLSQVSISADGYVVAFKVVRKQMPETIEMELDKLYPTFKRTKDREGGNVAKQAINRYYTEINNSVLRVVANPEFIEYLVQHKVLNKHLRFSVKAETPIELAELLIAISKIQVNATTPT